MKHKVLNHKESFEIVFRKLVKGDPFTFVRFGDGDHIIMYKHSLGKVVGGGNQFYVTQKLQDEIIECYNIVDDNFLVGTMLNDTLPHQMMKFESRINHSMLPDLVERETMLAMSCLFEIFLKNTSLFKKFSQELRKTRTMFVCGYNHPNIAKVYGSGVYIKVPIKNCYATIDDWYPEIVKNSESVDKIILSAGFAGRVVAKRLFKEGIKKIVLDVGSLSDVFIYHTGLKNQIKRRTFMRHAENKIYAKDPDKLIDEISELFKKYYPKKKQVFKKRLTIRRKNRIRKNAIKLRRFTRRLHKK